MLPEILPEKPLQDCSVMFPTALYCLFRPLSPLGGLVLFEGLGSRDWAGRVRGI